MPKRLRMLQVDAFTNRLFGGNPAAVVFVEGVKLDDTTRQQIAAENNLSETAFLESLAAESFRTCEHFSLRWFTPSEEVPLCGHATLASAYALQQGADNQSQKLSFHTASGELLVTSTANGKQLELPMCPPSDPVPLQVTKDFIQAVIGSLPHEDIKFCAKGGMNYLLIALTSDTTQQQLESITPDYKQLLSLISPGTVRGVIVSTKGDGKPYDMLSRFFAPWAGVEEDPVTGSAHAVLGSYWEAACKNSSAANGTLRARQCSPRGGEMTISLHHETQKVVLTGHAVMFLDGWMCLPDQVQ